MDETNPCLVNVIESCREDYSDRFKRFMMQRKPIMMENGLCFSLADTTLFDDFIRLLRIKRRPNKK